MKNSRIYSFEAVIIRLDDKIDHGFIEFPYDVQKEFGTKGQVKVNATFNGHPYRGTLVKMGHHCHIIGITKEIRKAIGKNPGDIIKVTIQKDNEPRTVHVPEDLRERLIVEGLMEKFEKMSYTHRKEYVNSILEAKKEETRKSRIEKAIQMIINKK